MMKKNIYFFQWISDLGGADTRLKELIQLFSESGKYNLFCIPNDKFRLQEVHNTDFLKKYNVNILYWDELPDKAEGFAISFCNFRLFSESWRVNKIKSMGLKFIWSNDMMWAENSEIEAIERNKIDCVIFTSIFHKLVLSNKNPSLKNGVKNYIIPNYFHEINYDRKLNKTPSLKDKFVIGKLSRDDTMKYSENFPEIFNKINIKNKHFRFMGWGANLSSKFSRFNFNKNWELLSNNQETILNFLSQLDLYVFNAHHEYIENQSRSMIEAQLLGIPVITPNYGNFPNMIWHERTGFLWNNLEEFYFYIEKIYNNKYLYEILSNNAKSISRTIWCNKDAQINAWEIVFNNI
jgi:glycosyltransferase involved in cell wall biosynthesis